MRRRSWLEEVRGGVMWLFLAVYLVPVFWMLSTSFKRPGDVAASPPELVPLSPSLDAYGAIVSDPDFLQSFLTSAIVATGTMILTVVLATPAAYGLARWVGRGQSTVGMAFIVAQLLPAIVVATPIFILFSRLELTNTYVGLIIANATVTLPFATIILRPFLSRVPLELEEAAQLDGAGRVKSMTSVVLPLIRPGLITVASLSFIIAWGDLIFGLTLTTDLAYRPATVALTEFVTQFATRWDLLMAGAAATAAPIVLIYILLQRYIVPGLTEGSLD